MCIRDSLWAVHPPVADCCWFVWPVTGGVHECLPHLDVQLCAARPYRLSAWCWGAGYAYSCGLAIISGGGLFTLLKAWNGGDLFAAYGGVYGLQMVCFLAAALMTRRLDVVGFRNTVKTRFADVMEMAVD